MQAHKKILIFLEVRGFAVPDSQHHLEIRKTRTANRLTLEFQVRTEGVFSELGQTLLLTIPVAFRYKTRLLDREGIE